MKQKLKPDKHNKDAKKPEDSSKFVTAFTDASWSQGYFGYAVWVKSKEGVFETSKGGLIEKSHLAERVGLEAAVSYISSLDLTDRIVVIQCDCITELERLDITSLYVAGAIHVKKKHVKGHASGETNRSKVNTWCDTQALKARLEFQQQHQN